MNKKNEFISNQEHPQKKLIDKLSEDWFFVLSTILALLLIFGVFCVYFYFFDGEISIEHEKWGQFGDYVGGVLNPIFGFFGFVLLLHTFKLQRQELKQSIEELAKSAKALELQNQALAQQNFENTFFQLLRRYDALVSDLKHGDIIGRALIQWLYDNQLRNNIYPNVIQSTSEPTDSIEAPISAFNSFYTSQQHQFATYFRTLYHIFKFIDTSPLPESNKVTYANIARSQLSSYELCLLFYNGTSGEGKEGFKPLIEKYGILKHLDANLLLHPNHRENRMFYNETAFLGRSGRAKFHEAAETE